MRVRLSVALITVLLAGCSTTVSGRGAAASPAPGTSTTGPTRVPADRAPCGVAAPAGPFCYTLPAGFTDYSQLPTYGPGWTYRTLVSIALHDLVEVLGEVVQTDTDTLDAARLRALYFATQQLKVGRYSVVTASAPVATRTAGARAFVQQAQFTGGVRTTTWTIYRGRTLVSVQCQSQKYPARVSAGCREVVASLEVMRR